MTMGKKLTTLRIIAERTLQYARDREMSNGDEHSWRLAQQMRHEAEALEWAIAELSPEESTTADLIATTGILGGSL
jgi:hypothetical protein